MTPARELLKKHVLPRLPGYGFRRYKNAVLPPLRLRTGGRYFRSDEDYYVAAAHEADRLIRHADLSASSRILDVGCGAGRLPIGLLIRSFEVALYHGVDVDRDRVEWCRRNLGKQSRRFVFDEVEAQNARYNPEGKEWRAERLPYAGKSYSIVYLYSVFSHMLTPELTFYLDVFAKVLAPGGTLFFTAFVEDDVPDCEENPKGYGDIAWTGPLHCVRFNRPFFEMLLKKHGFLVKRFEHRTETDGQSAYYLTR